MDLGKERRRSHLQCRRVVSCVDTALELPDPVPAGGMGERRVVLEAPLQGHHLGIGTRYAAKRANQAELARDAICHETKACATAVMWQLYRANVSIDTLGRCPLHSV